MNRQILVTQSSIPPLEEYIEEIKSIWDSHWMTNMGPKHQQLQKNLKEYLGVERIDLLTNGHMALELSMQAAGSFSEKKSGKFAALLSISAIFARTES